MIPTVVAIGNSHVRYFLGREEDHDRWHSVDTGGRGIRTFQMGATGATIWGLASDRSAAGARTSILRECASGSLSGSDVVIVLGDVDLKRHIVRDPDWHAAARRTAWVYEGFLREHVAPAVRGRLLILDIVPPAKQNLRMPEMTGMSGSEGTLLSVCDFFSACLDDMARRNGWTLMSPFRVLATDDQFIPPGLMNGLGDEETHLRYADAQRAVLDWLDRHPALRE